MKFSLRTLLLWMLMLGALPFLVSAFLDSVFRDLGDLYWNVRVCIWRGFAGRKHFFVALPWEFRLVPQPRNARSPSGGRMPPSFTRGIFTIPLDRFDAMQEPIHSDETIEETPEDGWPSVMLSYVR